MSFTAVLVWRDPASLKPYQANAKNHPPSQIAKIKRAIADHGFDVPIVVDSHDVIIKGHGRREAALELGLAQVPVIVRADLSDEQTRIARLADNRIAESDWDIDTLLGELDAILDQGLFDIEATGFDAIEIDALRHSFDDTQAAEVPEAKLDKDSRVTCPECGHHFEPKRS